MPLKSVPVGLPSADAGFEVLEDDEDSKLILASSRVQREERDLTDDTPRPIGPGQVSCGAPGENVSKTAFVGK